jgi:hypothetical protein
MRIKKYLKKRKRNAVTFILILIPFKTLIHYLFFTEGYDASWSDTYIWEELSYTEHFDYLLPFNEGSVLAWLLSIIILSLIVFAISDKIKAR